MRTEKVNSLSFNAQFVNNKAKIKKFVSGSFNNYNGCNAYLVKIDCSNSGDINALEKISRYWQYGNFATNICYVARAIRNKSKYYNGHEVYALTTQTADYDKLDCDKVLGLAHTSFNNDGSILLEHLQANPEIIYSRQPEYKGIGSGILTSFKDFMDKIYCCPSPASVRNFYEKNGFKRCEGSCNTKYEWAK